MWEPVKCHHTTPTPVGRYTPTTRQLSYGSPSLNYTDSGRIIFSSLSKREESGGCAVMSYSRLSGQEANGNHMADPPTTSMKSLILIYFLAENM